MKFLPVLIISFGTFSQLDLLVAGQESTVHPSTIADDENRLYDRLLHSYNRYIFPAAAAHGLNVSLGFDILRIMNVDPKKDLLSLSAYQIMTWIDHRLSWDPTDYSGIKNLILPLEHIWSPDITLYNAFDPGVTKAGYHVHVTHTGSVMWVPHVQINAHCELDVGLAEQFCELSFGSWVLDGFKMNIRFSEQLGLSSYVENKYWDLVEATAKTNIAYYKCCPEPYPKVVMQIKLKEKEAAVATVRKDLKFAFAVPAFFSAFLNCVMFVLPPACNEKILFGLAVLFGYGYLLEQVIVSQAAVGIHVSFVGVLIFCMFMATLSTLFAAWVLNMEYREPRFTQMPAKLKSFVFGCLARVMFVDVSDVMKATDSPHIYRNLAGAENSSVDKADTHDDNARLIDLLEEVRRHNTRSHPFITQWRMAAFVVDRFFLAIFIVFFVIMVIAAIAI